MSKPAFVLVYGAGHSYHTWDALVPVLEADGHAVETLDLPGAKANAAMPNAFNQRPIDLAAFATEPSPNGGVTS